MKRLLRPMAAWLGLLGSFACSGAMALAVAGVLGSGVVRGASLTGMGGMSGTGGEFPGTPHVSGLPTPPLAALGLLVEAGPYLLIVSIAAIALAVGLRRRLAMVPVAAAGILLYWGMYVQTAAIPMYASIVVGLAAFLAAYAWSTASSSKPESTARGA